MNRPPDRDQETRELITRFQASRARRRRLGLLSAGLVGAVLLAAVVVAVVWATGRLHADDAAGLTVASSSTATNAPPASDAPGADAGAPTITATAADGNPTTTGPGVAGSNSASSATTRGGTADSTSATASPRLLGTASTTTTVRATSPAQTTTTAAPTRETPPPPPASAAGGSQKVVVIDPGHQARGDSSLEPIGPGSTQMKAKVSSGTAGVVTGIPESELNLVIGLKLRAALEASGIKVVMTRTSQDVRISNIERVQIANDAGADLFVRIHADGSDNPAVEGIHVLYPASIEGWTDDIAAPSKKAAQMAQSELIAATGAKDRGIDARSDMTGFNWSDVPAIIPEIGFMTNPEEDKLLATDSYRDMIVKGLTRAILSFLGLG